MLKNMHKKWMQLDPSAQYLCWIGIFSATLFVFIMALVFLLHFNIIDIQVFPLISGMILGFISCFCIVVIFLNIIWPHKFEAAQKEYADKKQTKGQ